MKLERLELINFKGYAQLALAFPKRITLVLGPNGGGKTNLLDAIYYLSFTKSAFSSTDVHCVKHGENSFLIRGTFTAKDSPFTAAAAYTSGQKKIFRYDQEDYIKLSDHIGKIPVVLLAPDDVDLIRGGGEARRRFFDSLISQVDHAYLESLIEYNNALRQRNELLKMFAARGNPDFTGLEYYDHVLSSRGTSIYQTRKVFIEELFPVFRSLFSHLVKDNEIVSIDYATDVTDTNFAEGLTRNRNKDFSLQRTSFGTHRDDVHFRYQEGDLKKLGSQGQQKSFVIALKLAQAKIIESHRGISPILLMDDVFDKLDDERIERLLELIRNVPGQIFLTDARPERSVQLMGDGNPQVNMLHVIKGSVEMI